MTAKERLHRLVDDLPDEEAAEALDELVHWRAGRGQIAGEVYGPDFSALTDEDRVAIARAEAEIDAGDVLDEEDVRERLRALRRQDG
jgi:hypothetical protein